jgi:homoserine kinase type II
MDMRLFPLLRTQYGLESVQVVQKLVTSGHREAYLLQTELGRLVLKITDPDRPEEVVRSDVAVLDTVAQFDFPAPRPVFTREKRLYLPLENRFFYIYHFVEGKKPLPSASMLSNCGALLATLHTLPVDETARTSLHRPAYLLTEVKEWLNAAPDTPAQQRMAREMLATIAAFPSFEELPESLIHTDPYFVNLVDGADGRLYLIDWEDAGVSFPLIDVGYVGHLCTYLPHDRLNLGLSGDEAITWRPDWAQAFLDGYQAVRPLSRREQELFPWAVRLNYLMYIWDWDERRIIPENYQRMQLLEELRPIWR